MPTNDDVGRRFLFETAHGVQPLFEMPMVAFNAIVEILRGTMLNIRQDCAEGGRIALRLVGCHPFRLHAGLVDGMFEEGPKLAKLLPAAICERSLQDIGGQMST